MLRHERLSDTAGFCYFLAVMAFDWFQFTIIATTPTPRISPWSMANSWATFLITLCGLAYLYFKNGGAAGKHFTQRYFPLSVTVGLKFIVVMHVMLILLPIALDGVSREVLGWMATISISILNIIMFWRIGCHLEALRHAKQEAQP